MSPTPDETRHRLAELLRAAGADLPERPIEPDKPVRLALRAIRLRTYALVVGFVVLIVVLTTTAAVADNRIRRDGGPTVSPTSASLSPSSTTSATPSSSSSSAPGSTDASPVVPTVQITSGPQDPTKLTMASFVFKTDPANAPTECSLDGAEATSCESGVEFPDLGEGPHGFEVWSLDGAGNPGPPAAYRWTIDLTPPTVTLESAVLDYGIRANVDCTVDGKAWVCTQPVTDGGAHRYRAYIFGGSDTTLLTWDFTSGLDEVSFAAGPQPAGSAALILTFAIDEEAVGCAVDGKSSPCDQPIRRIEKTGIATTTREEIEVTAIDAAGNVSEGVVFDWGYSWVSFPG
jgi:hypothetical protein